jgi:hypothetical protein
MRASFIKSLSQNDIFFLARTWTILKEIMGAMLHFAYSFFFFFENCLL